MRILLLLACILLLNAAYSQEGKYTIKTVRQCETTNYVSKCDDAKSASITIVIGTGAITVTENSNTTSYTIHDLAEDGSQRVYKVARGTLFSGFIIDTSEKIIVWNSSFTNDKNFTSKEYRY